MHKWHFLFAGSNQMPACVRLEFMVWPLRKFKWNSKNNAYTHTHRCIVNTLKYFFDFGNLHQVTRWQKVYLNEDVKFVRKLNLLPKSKYSIIESQGITKYTKYLQEVVKWKYFPWAATDNEDIVLPNNSDLQMRFSFITLSQFKKTIAAHLFDSIKFGNEMGIS